MGRSVMDGTPAYVQIEFLERTNAQLEQRIAQLQTQAADYEYNAAQIITARDKRIEELEQKHYNVLYENTHLKARLNALELKSAMPWEEDWERGYVCGWNECRKAALEQK